jgi:cobalt/nickel transport system permease protein
MTLAFDLPTMPESALARMDPRWKLAALAPAALLMALVHTVLAAALALVFMLGLAQWGRLPGSWLARRLGWMALLLLLFVIWLPLLPDPESKTILVAGLRISLHGLDRVGVVLLKTLAVVTAMLIVLATAPLYDTLKAAQALHVPGLLVHILLLTMRYVFLLAEEFTRLRTALRVRGYKSRADLHSWRTVGHVAGTLLVRGSERAERVSQAMRCRGFDGTFRNLHRFQTRWQDVVGWMFIVLAAGAILAWDFWQRSSGTPHDLLPG